MGQDLLERVPMDVELAAYGAFALAVDEDATADLGPFLHLSEHPGASQHGPTMQTEAAIVGSQLEAGQGRHVF